MLFAGCEGEWTPDAEETAIAALLHFQVSADGFNSPIAVLHGGRSAGRPVLFVHGTPGNGRGWADYLLEADDRYRMLALDRPSFGGSVDTGAVTSLESQAAAALAALEESEQPAILVGHSLGAPIVARAAAAAPDRIGAVILIAGSLDPELEKIHPAQRLGNAWPVRHWLPRTLRHANEELLALEEELRLLQPMLRSITQPVIIVHGTEDRLVPYDNVAFMQRTLINAEPLELIRLDGANHFLPWNARAVIRDAIDRAHFLIDAS